jgi:hypothetical protein
VLGATRDTRGVRSAARTSGRGLLRHAGRIGSYNGLVELTREFIKLVQIERLVAKLGEYYQDIMRIYYGFGYAETARKYGQASLKFAEIFL